MSNASSFPVWLDYVTVADGSATGGPLPGSDWDYQNTTGRLTWRPTWSFPQQIVIPIKGDQIHEG